MKIPPNVRFTLHELAQYCGTVEILNKWQPHALFLAEEVNDLIRSGRLNHPLLSNLISKLSNGQFAYGGQGDSSPDLFYTLDTSKVEQKGFQKNSEVSWCAKSKFFANNSGVKQLKEQIRNNASDKQIKNFLSYSDNKHYLFSATAQWDGDLFSTECIFTETENMLECLIPMYQNNKPFCFIDLKKLRNKISCLK